MAFLSYSHDDAEMADWLHEALEEFHVPPRLVGKLTDHGPIPKQLAPIFRDRHELAAASDLGEEIEEAIAGSRFLIVLCSMSAAKSRWIDEEIACFKRLHREDRILAAIIDGEPFASDDPGHEAEECFPAALRVHFDRRGRPTAQRAEPIAADLRDGGDGRKMGLLKIAAGMMGVGLDDLAQREAQRRHRRLYAITAASVAGMLVASGLAYTAIDARDEARDQRREAEGLIGFMLGDLRDKLEPVGRLDVLDAVGARALAYYEKQDKTSLSDEALAQRSKALTLIGQIAASRGDLDGALRRYREALAGTAEELRRFPNDPQRMYDHAQSVFFVGETARLRGQIDEAAVQFREYRRLAQRMMALQPDNPKWQLEGVYSASNLGIVELQQAKYVAAVETFQTSVRAMDRLLAAEPNNVEYLQLMENALAYYADALDRAGKLDLAIQQREHQLSLLAPYLAQDRPDANLRQHAMIANMHLSLLRFARGETQSAVQNAAAAVEVGRQLVELEPANADWKGRSADTQLNQALLLLRSGRIGDAGQLAEAGCAKTDSLMVRDPSIIAWRDGDRECLRLRAEMAMRGGSRAESLAIARQLLNSIRADNPQSPKERFAPAQALKLMGDLQWLAGDRSGARASWTAGLSVWPKNLAETPRQLAERGEMLRGIGRRAEGMRIASQLASMGYRQSLSDRAKL
ncbi:TIR domain-containing protein [Sphingomonas sp. G124]|uniref:TIR domain-containing protein n=1 Tax=Sphingomonas cremea TaxID=2904799 RepID=A0A9X1TYP4_9SPHN|nr:TIR domain-containing protein [Sphingomonas cremea]MCF2515047.1 TIR domain-containing protein [Sphingomonas cremea]